MPPTRGREPGQLTDRQIEVRDLVVEGLNNAEIADRLGISRQAVKQHVSRLLAKYAVSNRTAFARRSIVERALDRRDQELQALFEHAPVMAAITRGRHHVLEYANRPLLERVGGDAVVGRRARQVRPDIGGQGLYRMLDAVFATGELRAACLLVAKAERGGERHVIDFVAYPLRGADDQVERIMVLINADRTR